MKIATAILTEDEHAEFMEDLSSTRSYVDVKVTREGGVTTVSNKDGVPPKEGDGMFFFCWGLEEGFLYSCSEKFTITEVD
ncbi:MAG: hypothetical protein A2845_00705 [Candidatus Lloydbacteria bacterium RIFCSPHIGHO2_01_FULL_49_22]|uniref:Uncharacterized protein n=1 Tax=Candidatus Lloydbacteria bacterium RIFCSPHIGHO2_01_FULL_49_22 TaxID=1798658 RepID=A0A1G2CY58_9BACT|nr:MAG: hypothetical protein A2845_00705 [Candidatus Lloydbacteria bacterium RIFCSPHIGHO2_01_FULL_49_22]OGZ09377.1 MAG: hypothetical protein A3C14_05610 [Candidatus Lloydbacteria bacterium RIFCSPHIGHO2_02_FULL_50_18]